MTIKSVCVWVLAASSFSCVFAGETVPKEYKAGSGEAVKAWVTRNYDQLKGGMQPMAIYLYDVSLKRNQLAYHFEGAEGLNSAGLKDKISKFAKIKVKSDGTDAKGWPDEMFKSAKGGALLILMSSDMTITIVFDKTKSLPERSKEAIEAAAGVIQAHEDKLKAARDKEDKKAAVAEKAKEKEMEKEKTPDLTIKLEPKKPDPPKKAIDKGKAVDKVADAKAAADAKNAPVDPKKEAAKKPPQDE